MLNETAVVVVFFVVDILFCSTIFSDQFSYIYWIDLGLFFSGFLRSRSLFVVSALLTLHGKWKESEGRGEFLGRFIDLYLWPSCVSHFLRCPSGRFFHVTRILSSELSTFSFISDNLLALQNYTILV